MAEITIPQMLAKLDLMYDEQEAIEKQVELLYNEYSQLKDDIDMAETIIMHQSNKRARSTL